MDVFSPSNAAALALVTWRLGILWKKRNAAAAAMGAAVAAVPALMLVVGYLHVFDNSIWYLEWRSRPGTEFMSGLLGLSLGVFWKSLEGLRSWAVAIVALLVLVPFAKQILSPLPGHQLADLCEGIYCRQSSQATCGPASAATILRKLGLRNVTESELARLSATTRTGTEIWYLARALRGMGVPVVFSNNPQLRRPSIAGVRLPGGSGHFIAWLGSDDGWFDPRRGRIDPPLQIAPIQLVFPDQANTSETTRAGN